MKRQIISCILSLGCSWSAGAITFTYNVGATIPDGNLNGYQNSQVVSALSGAIADLNVTLNVSGGFNGDFYAFLAHDGVTSILLNRVGRNGTHAVGYPDFGFGPDASGSAFTFDDQALRDVHLYRSFSYSLNGSGQLTGAWQPDGRTLDPLSPGTSFDAAARSGFLGAFNGLDPNGVWTLYVADVSAGSEGTLVGWGLQITTVPEPTGAALLGVGLAALLCTARSGKRRLRK